MSLKSGLLTESTWVLNVLNILLCDNTMVAYFYLGHHPNLLRMLDRLLDHFQKVNILSKFEMEFFAILSMI